MQITPQFQIEAPPELAAFRDRFASEDPRRFEAILELVGLQDAGGPIRVVLAPESSDLARQTPD